MIRPPLAAIRLDQAMRRSAERNAHPLSILSDPEVRVALRDQIIAEIMMPKSLMMRMEAMKLCR
jgi:spore coat protein CotF